MYDTISPDDEQTRFEQLLPFYVTNRLAPEDKDFIEAYLAGNPDARNSLKFTDDLRDIVRNIGVRRNPEPALNRLLLNFESCKKLSNIARLLQTLRSLGHFIAIAIVLMVSIGQVTVIAVHKINWTDMGSASAIAPENAHLSITIKHRTDYAAIALIIEKFGAHIVHASFGNGAEKIFINIADKADLQPLIDALMGAEYIDAAALLF